MDLSTPVAALSYIQGISYVIMFCLFLIEGPIFNYVVGFASSLGFFNIFIVLLLAVAGNVIGDIIYFFLGRIWGTTLIKKYLERSINSSKTQKIKTYLKNNPGKTIFVVKTAPLVPVPGLILIGTTNIKFKNFLYYSIVFSVIQCMIMVFIGYYSGKLFGLLFSYVKYSSYLIGAFIILSIGIYFLIKYIMQKLSSKIEDI